MARCTRASGRKTGEKGTAFVSTLMDPDIKGIGKTTKEMAWVFLRSLTEQKEEEPGRMM